MEYALIVACTPSGGIGKNNKIPSTGFKLHIE